MKMVDHPNIGKYNVCFELTLQITTGMAGSRRPVPVANDCLIFCCRTVCETCVYVLLVCTRRCHRNLRLFVHVCPVYSSTLRAVGPFQLPVPQSGTLSPILSGTRPSVQTVSGVCLKRICSLDTSAFSTLEVPDDNCALSIYLLTYTKRQHIP